MRNKTKKRFMDDFDKFYKRLYIESHRKAGRLLRKGIAPSFIYYKWLEYEFSDVGKENYESLQGICEKIFRISGRSKIKFHTSKSNPPPHLMMTGW